MNVDSSSFARCDEFFKYVDSRMKGAKAMYNDAKTKLASQVQFQQASTFCSIDSGIQTTEAFYLEQPLNTKQLEIKVREDGSVEVPTRRPGHEGLAKGTNIPLDSGTTIISWPTSEVSVLSPDDSSASENFLQLQKSIAQVESNPIVNQMTITDLKLKVNNTSQSEIFPGSNLLPRLRASQETLKSNLRPSGLICLEYDQKHSTGACSSTTQTPPSLFQVVNVTQVGDVGIAPIPPDPLAPPAPPKLEELIAEPTVKKEEGKGTGLVPVELAAPKMLKKKVTDRKSKMKNKKVKKPKPSMAEKAPYLSKNILDRIKEMRKSDMVVNVIRNEPDFGDSDNYRVWEKEKMKEKSNSRIITARNESRLNSKTEVKKVKTDTKAPEIPRNKKYDNVKSKVGTLPPYHKGHKSHKTSKEQADKQFGTPEEIVMDSYVSKIQIDLNDSNSVLIKDIDNISECIKKQEIVGRIEQSAKNRGVNIPLDHLLIDYSGQNHSLVGVIDGVTGDEDFNAGNYSWTPTSPNCTSQGSLSPYPTDSSATASSIEALPLNSESGESSNSSFSPHTVKRGSNIKRIVIPQLESLEADIESWKSVMQRIATIGAGSPDSSSSSVQDKPGQLIKNLVPSLQNINTQLNHWNTSLTNQ